MTRILDEENFMELVESENPKAVYYSMNYSFFGTAYSFWFYTGDNIKNKLKENCRYCFRRIRANLEKKDIKLINVD